MSAQLSASVTAATADAEKKPYHAKRPHRKSRTGCRNCKARKVKCDEGRPVCGACALRNEDNKCVYITAPKRGASSSSREGSSPTLALMETRSATPGTPTAPASPHPQPLFIPLGHDELDMRLLWFYTAATYASFSSGRLKERNVDIILKVNVVQLAFANPFLMNCVLGLSAMHINHVGLSNMGITRQQEIRYRAQAVETYRKAVEAAEPSTFHALLAASLVMCGLSTHMFRGDDARPLAILDWMVVWKGIGTIIEVTQLPKSENSGIAQLVFRPPVDLNASAGHVPSYLLFMITSIKPGDPDTPLIDAYYTALKYLGSLYREMRNGFSQVLLLRIVCYFTFLPQEFVDAARERRPRALVIVAHYLVFAKLRILWAWWMEGIAATEIPNVYRAVEPEWHPLLRVPMASLLLDDDRAVARLLLDDPAWDSPGSMEDEPMSAARERELSICAAAASEGEEEVSVQVGPYQPKEYLFDVL